MIGVASGMLKSHLARQLVFRRALIGGFPPEFLLSWSAGTPVQVSAGNLCDHEAEGSFAEFTSAGPARTSAASEEAEIDNPTIRTGAVRCGAGWGAGAGDRSGVDFEMSTTRISTCFKLGGVWI
jgi:hypothetical protein